MATVGVKGLRRVFKHGHHQPQKQFQTISSHCMLGCRYHSVPRSFCLELVCSSLPAD